MDYVVVVSHNLMLNIFLIKVRGNRIEQRGISFLKSYVTFSPLWRSLAYRIHFEIFYKNPSFRSHWRILNIFQSLMFSLLLRSLTSLSPQETFSCEILVMHPNNYVV